MFESKKAAKTAVSALRRELKALDKPVQDLSHADCLELLARTLGQKNWNELEARLPLGEAMQAPQAPAPSPAPAATQLVAYFPSRLVNDGRFDFADRATGGVAVGSRFEPLQGTYERTPGACSVARARRENGASLKMDHAGGTEMFWDDQRTVRERGESVWVDEDGEFLRDSDVVLLPEGFEGDPYEDENLPVREALLDAYQAFLKDKEVALGSSEDEVLSQLNAVRQVLGFALTAREEQVLLSRLGKAGAEDAYRAVFNRVFADEGDKQGTVEFTRQVMQTLQDAPRSFWEAVNGEAYLRKKVDGHITLNGPYDVLSVRALYRRLRALAITQYEKTLLATRHKH
ncbi:hypothetical protein D3C71_19630 [compost metagenome]